MKKKLQITKRQEKELRALAAMPDDEIDLSDAPELKDWSRAIVGRFYRPIKKSLTIRLDADVLAWLREDGNGYQTRINALLRSAMTQQKRESTTGLKRRYGRTASNVISRTRTQVG